MKELSVSAIKDGTVIDHIPSDVVFKVVDIMGLQDVRQAIMVASNLESDKHERKGLVKVSGLELSNDLLDKIAIIAPTATVNIIKNYGVSRKFKVQIPKILINLIRCPNPNCITNHDKIPTKAIVIRESPLKIQCYYCEKYSDDDIGLDVL